MSLGPNFYFTGSLIYIQKLTLEAMLLVQPMPQSIVLANRQARSISTLPISKKKLVLFLLIPFLPPK